MYIGYKTKKRDKDEHIYSLIIRIDKEDFSKEEIIREFVLKIKILPYFNWNSNDRIKKHSEVIGGKECNTFEVRRKDSLYLEDMPFEIIGPKADIGEILYSVTNENHHNYLKNKVLLWKLYGEGVLSKNGKKELRELQNF
ncbi:MAG: hypothetical protein KJI70_00440 [Patescibacteria group bacterium]|nr:hypothetical protein [Patescibacteria group bacterium]